MILHHDNTYTIAKGPPPTVLPIPPQSTYAAHVTAAGGEVITLSGKISAAGPLSFEFVKRKLLAAGGATQRIHLMINSGGGDVSESFRIYNFLRNQPAQISAEVVRQCHSAAVIVYLAAAHRLACIDTEFLIHRVRIQGSAFKPEAELTARHLRERAEELQRDDDANLDLLCERTGYQREWFQAELESETPLEISEALECGIVHEIVDTTMPCDPRWPEQVRTIPKNIIWPSYYLTPNFFAACRASVDRASCIGKHVADRTHKMAAMPEDVFDAGIQPCAELAQ